MCVLIAEGERSFVVARGGEGEAGIACCAMPSALLPSPVFSKQSHARAGHLWSY